MQHLGWPPPNLIQLQFVQEGVTARGSCTTHTARPSIIFQTDAWLEGVLFRNTEPENIKTVSCSIVSVAITKYERKTDMATT